MVNSIQSAISEASNTGSQTVGRIISTTLMAKLPLLCTCTSEYSFQIKSFREAQHIKQIKVAVVEVREPRAPAHSASLANPLISS